jgi:hypothetical protein
VHACHAIIERLKVLDVWLPPHLVILWREIHPDAPYQPTLRFSAGGVGLENFNAQVVELEL